MKKILIVVAAISVLGHFPLNTGAITVESNNGMQTNAPVITDQKPDTIYLLRWIGNRLSTTQGTFLTDGVEVVNESGIEKDAIARQEKPPIIKIIKGQNRIVKIIILPNR